MNEELEKGLQHLVAQTTAQWSANLIWDEFARNSLPSVSTGFSQFECVYGYQPPLFQALEWKAAVLSAVTLIQQCHRVGVSAKRTLLRTSASYKVEADRGRVRGPDY